MCLTTNMKVRQEAPRILKAKPCLFPCPPPGGAEGLSLGNEEPSHTECIAPLWSPQSALKPWVAVGTVLWEMRMTMKMVLEIMAAKGCLLFQYLTATLLSTFSLSPHTNTKKHFSPFSAYGENEALERLSCWRDHTASEAARLAGEPRS